MSLPLASVFESLDDPRFEHNQKHRLTDISGDRTRAHRHRRQVGATLAEGHGHGVLAPGQRVGHRAADHAGSSECAGFSDACAVDLAGVSFEQHATVETGHGRVEERYVTVISNPAGLPSE